MSHNLVSDLCLCVKAGINPLGNCRPAYPAAAYCGGAVSRGRCCRAPGTPCLPWLAQAIPLSLSLLPSLKRITFYSKAGQQTHYNEGWNRSTFLSLNIPLKTCLPSFPSRSPSLLCDGEAFSSPPLPIPVCFKLFTKTPSSFSFLIFLDPRCSHSLWFYFFFPLWWIVGRQHPFRPFPAGDNFSIFGFAVVSSEPHPCLCFAVPFCFFKGFWFNSVHSAQTPLCRQPEFPNTCNKLLCKWWDPNANSAAECPTFHGVCIWFPTINGVRSVFLLQLYYSPAYLPEIIWAAELSDSFDQN